MMRAVTLTVHTFYRQTAKERERERDRGPLLWKDGWMERRKETVGR